MAETDERVEIGARIREARAALELSQGKFAEDLGIKPNTVSVYESGLKKPSGAVATLMQNIYGINKEWLFTGKGDMFIPGARDPIDAYIHKYGLIPETRSLLEAYKVLDAQGQRALITFLQALSDRLQAYPRSEPVSREDIHAELDRQLSEEETAEAAS